jgi:outer membrane receptor protein involved in Fe transport
LRVKINWENLHPVNCFSFELRLADKKLLGCTRTTLTTTSTISVLTQVFRKASALLLLLALGSIHSFAEIGVETDFSVPKGQAVSSLKLAALQGQVEILFTDLVVQGVETNAIQGRFTPMQALNLLVEGTQLRAILVYESGAFAIQRIPSEDKNLTDIKLTPNEEQNTTKDMTELSRPTRSFWKRILALGVATTAVTLTAQEREERSEEVFDLSPFTISGEEDNGYMATSTLAGTRIKTKLEDVGASITAITQQFMDDTGSTNLNDLLVYTANTESATVGGNYSGAVEQSDAFGRGFQSGASSITNPQGAQRLRGLSSADITRNLFRSSLTWDDYNIDRVEIVRGANSMLFGQGSPAGIINVNLIRPFFENAHELKVRFDDQGSLRTTFDSNLVLVEDKLAIRVAGLQDNFNFRQKPAFEDDQRIYAAATWNINDTLTLRVNGEVGNIRANRANPFGPTDGFSDYIDLVGLATYPVTGADQPRVGDLYGVKNVLPAGGPRIFVQYGLNLEADGSLAGTSPSTNTTRWSLATSSILANNPDGIPRQGRTMYVTRPNYEIATGVGLVPKSLPDYSIFDWKNHFLSGDFPYQNQDFETFQAALEYLSKDGHFGAELAFDYQTEDREIQAGPTGSRDYIVRLDVSQQTFDGTANPNVLRPVMHLTQNINAGSEDTTTNEAMQINAFAKFDFVDDAGWDNWIGHVLGDHTLTLYGSSVTNLTNGITYDETWVGENIENNASDGLTPNRPFGHNHRDVGSAIYLGPKISSINDISITPLSFSARDYFPNGQTYQVRVWDKESQTFRTIPMSSVDNIAGLNDQKTVTDTKAVILQSNWLDDYIITTLGYREDDLTRTSKQFGTAPGTANSVSPDIIGSIQEDVGKGDYFSWSVVAKSPRNWDLPFGTRFNLFYSESENFDPSDVGRVDLLIRSLAPQSGITKDYGIRINTMNEKLELKLNFFETSLAGQSFTGGLTGIAMTEMDIRFRELTFINGVDAGYLNPNDSVLTTFGEPPAQVLAERNATLNAGGVYEFSGGGRITDTTDTSAEGMELEIVFNPTKEWRMIFNVARQETVQTNSLQGVQDYIALRLPAWETAFKYPQGLVNPTILAEPGMVGSDGYLNVNTFAAAYPNNTREADYDRRLRVPLQAILDTDGGVVREQRKWRFNMITNYTFNDDTKLKGFNVGGAVRWQDKNAIGNPYTTNADGETVIDINNPYYGPKEIKYDAWVGYRRPLMDGKIDWKVQLNIRNLFANDSPVVVTKDAFGNKAQYILPGLTSWSITNTFSF